MGEWGCGRRGAPGKLTADRVANCPSQPFAPIKVHKYVPALKGGSEGIMMITDINSAKNPNHHTHLEREN